RGPRQLHRGPRRRRRAVYRPLRTAQAMGRFRRRDAAARRARQPRRVADCADPRGPRLRRGRGRRCGARLPDTDRGRAGDDTMIGALVRKELRELLPWGVLMGALAISEIAVLLVEQIDMLPLGSTFPSLNNAETILYW